MMIPVYLATKIRRAAEVEQLARAWVRHDVKIVSTWHLLALDGCFDGRRHWPLYVREAMSASAIVVWGDLHPGETLKGCLIEVGAALSTGAQVVQVGKIAQFDEGDHSFTEVDSWHQVDDIAEAPRRVRRLLWGVGR